MKTFNFTNADGYEFKLSISSEGDANGDIVEFYDVKHNQFVSSYYVRTVLQHNGGRLCLQGGVPEWSVDAESMRLVKDWLKTI